ncbi:hypothetical protein M408DRAFT_307690 [Serendipita vermifera MAFF 305830]|uniref:MARVEL domain-containing protein n=1 Tax=Serendipita vermifera MAFF 305830 TaxID=933852 RepID=A0A0C3A765_SERVB|nr:hypothetical protein M408DRAFT_307690 [Serendipita vermifera MAFF 305830]
MGVFENYGGQARCILYVVLAVWSFILFCTCCSRLGYTSHWRDEPSLNGGRPFYDPCIAELLVASILGEIFSLMMLYQILYQKEQSQFGKNWFEVGGLVLLWLLWIGGAAAASTVWPDLSWCTQYQPCVLLQALMGFAWLGWLTLTALLIGTVYRFKVRNAKWDEHHWNAWGDKTFEMAWRREHATQMKDVEQGEGVPPVPSKA